MFCEDIDKTRPLRHEHVIRNTKYYCEILDVEMKVCQLFEVMSLQEMAHVLKIRTPKKYTFQHFSSLVSDG